MSSLGGITDITNVLRYPLHNRILHISSLGEQVPYKELQAVFPQIIRSIFSDDTSNSSWGLRTLTQNNHPSHFRLLHEFLSPAPAARGGLFTLIYKLLGDPQTRYQIPVRLLPIDLYDMLQSKRIPKFYFDTLVLDPQNRNIVSLSLNPFDFYMFHFAIHLCDSSCVWDNWNTLYYTLACDYLLHFLPRDPNTPVLPYIPYFTGKTPVVSPLQTVNRQCQFPSLFTCQEMSVNITSSSPSTQLHPRGEMWRSETVLQVFTDVWLNKSVQTSLVSVSDSLPNNINSYPASEHVRITRLLVKQCHCFAMSAASDLSSLGELRRITTATLAPRAVLHIRHLMHTWPLDSSFRLVLELWFSFIQPWRYANIKDDNNDPMLEENHRCTVDRTFLPFISENLPAYTEIFQLVMPRFLRLDLTVPKNAIMLFRLTKVFSQSNLIQLLKEAENNVTMETDTSDVLTMFNNNSVNESDHQSADAFSKYSESGYFPAQGQRLQLFGSRQYACELMILAQNAHKIVRENIRIKETQSFMHKKGFVNRFFNFFFGENDSYDDIPFEELKKVPLYLNSSIQQLAEIFSLSISENSEVSDLTRISNISNEGCVRRNAIQSPQKAKERSNTIKYMGDPDLEPVRTFENGFLVKLSRHVSSKLNEMYSEEMRKVWERRDLIGSIGKEIIQRPLTIRHYGKDKYNSRVLVTETLPPRISLRGFASHKTIFWMTLFLICAYFSGRSVVLLNIALLILGLLWISIKGCFKHFFGTDVNSAQDSANESNFLDSTM